MSERFPLQLEDRLKEAWGLFAKAPEIFVTIAFVVFGSSLLFGYIPIVGQIYTLLAASVGPAAFYLTADDCARNGRASFESLRKLGALFPQLLSLLVAKSILITIGFLFFILPGVYLAVLLCFAELFVVIENKPFLEAMRASKALVEGNWFRVFGLCLVAGMIGFSGFLLIGLGLLFTAPFAALLMYCIFKRSHTQVIS